MYWLHVPPVPSSPLNISAVCHAHVVHIATIIYLIAISSLQLSSGWLQHVHRLLAISI